MSTALTTPDQMTLEEFLAWDAPGPGPWQLIDGVPVAMAPAGRAHARLQAVIAGLIDSHLETSGSPCALTNPGIVPAFQASRNFFIPDAAVTCSETDTDPAALHHPVLVIELLSPSNHAEAWRNPGIHADRQRTGDPGHSYRLGAGRRVAARRRWLKA